jgi:hypothetical protein
MLRSKLFKYRMGLYKRRVSKIIGPPPEKGREGTAAARAETLPGVT